MDRAALRRVQEPLKRRYREEPEAALVTLRAGAASTSASRGRAAA